MKNYGTASQVFLLLALLGWIGWIATRFTGPVFRISYEGFLAFTNTCLLFAIAASLIGLGLSQKKAE